MLKKILFSILIYMCSTQASCACDGDLEAQGSKVSLISHNAKDSIPDEHLAKKECKDAPLLCALYSSTGGCIGGLAHLAYPIAMMGLPPDSLEAAFATISYGLLIGATVAWYHTMLKIFWIKRTATQ